MMTEYKFDAERFCRVRARSARAMLNFDDEANFLGVADRVRQLEYEVKVWKNKPAMNVQRKYDALVESVVWLREVDDTREWLMEFTWLRKWSGLDQCMNEVRAEVDRLIAAADCEGEG